MRLSSRTPMTKRNKMLSTHDPSSPYLTHIQTCITQLSRLSALLQLVKRYHRDGSELFEYYLYKMWGRFVISIISRAFLKQCKQWLSSLLGHPSKPGHKIALRRGNISPLEWHTRNSVEVTFDYKALATTLGLEKANTPVMFVVPWRASCMQNKYILCLKWYSIFFSSLETCHACDLCSVIFIRPTSL